MATGSRTPHTIAPEADQLEQALRAAGVDPDDALSFPYWNVFVNRGLRAALAALESRTDMEYKLEYKPLGGQRQQRSAPNGADELTDADRAHMKSGGRVAFTKNADGSTTKTYVRGPHGTTAKSGTVRPRVKQTQPAQPRPPSQAELQAIHDRWLSPEAQLAADTRAYTSLVDEALELNERRRRGRQ